MQQNAPFCVFLKNNFWGGGANPRPLTAISLSRVGMYVYMTSQFKRNPNTIPVSKIICTCTTIFLKFYNKCVNKNESGHPSLSC